MIKTKHKFLEETLVRATDRFAIIGTIHPAILNLLLFFYGNDFSLWRILNDAFPSLNLSSRKDIVEFLEKYGIWMTDMIKECSRADVSVTQDNDLRDIVLNTDSIRNGLTNSNISTVFFTSRWGKNNAAALFCKAFGLNRKSLEFINDNEFVIPAHLFGRPIKAVLLYSPSGNANVGISKSKAYQLVKSQYSHLKHPVKEFRNDFYRDKFQFLRA